MTSSHAGVDCQMCGSLGHLVSWCWGVRVRGLGTIRQWIEERRIITLSLSLSLSLSSLFLPVALSAPPFSLVAPSSLLLSSLLPFHFSVQSCLPLPHSLCHGFALQSSPPPAPACLRSVSAPYPGTIQSSMCLSLFFSSHYLPPALPCLCHLHLLLSSSSSSSSQSRGTVASRPRLVFVVGGVVVVNVVVVVVAVGSRQYEVVAWLSSSTSSWPPLSSMSSWPSLSCS